MFSFAKFLKDFNQTSNAIKVAMYIRDRTGNDSISLLGFIADLCRSTGDHLHAISTYRSILKLQANNVSASLNLSVSLALFGDIPNAILELERSLVINVDNSDLLLNLGNLYYLDNDFLKSKVCHIKALRNGANESLVLVNLCQTLRKLADWELLREYESRLSNLSVQDLQKNKIPSEAPLHCMLRCDDPLLLKDVTTAHASVLPNQLKLPPMKKGKRLRLGFVSDDLREHPVAHLLYPILRNLDKNRFETTLFWYGKGDNSKIRKLLFESVDHVHNLRYDYLSSRVEILNFNIDLLFDLKGWTINHYQTLFSLRAAPIQITFLGFAGGTQNASMDYVITDHIVVKNKEHFSESLIQMEHGCMPFGSDATSFSSVFHRKDFGLPEDQIIAAVCVATDKLTHELFLTWTRCFAKVKNSCLWVLSSRPEDQQQIRKIWLSQGLSLERLHFQRKPNTRDSGFLSKQEHLARISLADLVLDSWVYNGHSSTVDAIQARVPILCCLGSNWASRTSASILKSLGLGKFTCMDKSEYEEYLYLLLSEPELLDEWTLAFQKIDLSQHFSNWMHEFQLKLETLAENINYSS